MTQKEFKIKRGWSGPIVATGSIAIPSGACHVLQMEGGEATYSSPYELLDAYPPKLQYFILSIPEGWEMALDPFHADAFKGTPAEGLYQLEEPRKVLWIVSDWCGNLVGIGPSVTTLSGDGRQMPAKLETKLTMVES